MKLGKLATKMAREMDDKKPRKKTEVIVDNRMIDTRKYGGNDIEDRIAQALDHKSELKKYASLLERLDVTRDVKGFIEDIAPDIAAAMLLMAADPNTPKKLKVEMFKDLLDRAGHGKVTKHAHARFDANTSKDSIISTIFGSKKDLSKMGIEIVDDDNEDQPEGSGEADEG